MWRWTALVVCALLATLAVLAIVKARNYNNGPIPDMEALNRAVATDDVAEIALYVDTEQFHAGFQAYADTSNRVNASLLEIAALANLGNAEIESIDGATAVATAPYFDSGLRYLPFEYLVVEVADGDWKVVAMTNIDEILATYPDEY